MFEWLKQIGKPKQEQRSIDVNDLYYYLTSSSGEFLGGAIVNDSGYQNEKHDNRVNASEVYYASQDTVLYGLIEVGKNQFFAKGWYFKGGKNLVKQYTDILNYLDFNTFLLNLYYAMYGAGGGSALIYIKNEGNKRRLVCEPKYAEGYVRYNPVCDNNNRLISRYKIYNPKGTCFMELDSKKCYEMVFARPNNDYRWGTGPIIACLPYWKLKRTALQAFNTSYRRGLSGVSLLSPDFSAIQASPEHIKSQLEGALEKIKSKIEDSQGFRGRNSTIYSSFPIKATNLSKTASEMQMLGLIQELDVQMGGAYLIATSNLGFTKSVNYATSQQNRDNLTELAIEPFKRKVKLFVEEWLMPTLLKTYNRYNNPIVICKEPTDEDLEIEKLRLETRKQYIDMFVNLKKVAPTLSLTDDFLEGLPFVKITEESPEDKNVDGEEVLDMFDSQETQEQRADFETEKDEVYKKYHSLVNMTASELKAWSKTEASKLASLDRSPIARNIKLLSKKKADWTQADITNANRTISFISRMSKVEQGQEYKNSGYSKRDIALKNWAFDPHKRQDRELTKTELWLTQPKIQAVKAKLETAIIKQYEAD